MAHKLILTKGNEEQVREFTGIEEAFNAAMPWIIDGYVARVTDKHGVVSHTQVLNNGHIDTYLGDVSTVAAGTATGQPTASGSARRWWRFW